MLEKSNHTTISNDTIAVVILISFEHECLDKINQGSMNFMEGDEVSSNVFEVCLGSFVDQRRESYCKE
jgi:hypothetical protein